MGSGTARAKEQTRMMGSLAGSPRSIGDEGSLGVPVTTNLVEHGDNRSDPVRMLQPVQYAIHFLP
jgi:hypothetical protein